MSTTSRVPSTARADLAGRVCRVASGVLFVAVEDAILVAIDADALPGARRGAGIGQLTAALQGAGAVG